MAAEPFTDQAKNNGQTKNASAAPDTDRASRRHRLRHAGRRTGRLDRRLAGLPAGRRHGRAGKPVPAGRQPGALGAPAGQSAGDGGPPGRQTDRGHDQHRPRQLGDCRAAPGSPVRRPGVDGKSAAQADASDVPGARWNRSGSARRRRPGLAGQHAPAVPADQLHRCVRAQQQPSAQPGRLEGVHRQRRPEPAARPARLHLGHGLNSAHPDHGQAGRVHHWQGSGGDTGSVVLRTDVLELIQYKPTTPTVHQFPLLMVPPMINKYYITDLAPGRSMLEFFISQGHQMFVISWRNPDGRARHWDIEPLRRGHPGRDADRPGDHQSPQAQRDRAVRRRHHDLDGQRAPERHRPAGSAVQPGAGRDAARHDGGGHDRLADGQGHGRGVHPRLPRPRLHGRAHARRGIRLAPARRPDLDLLGQQLPGGEEPAAVRHPVLERRHHPDARRAAP